MDSSGQQTALGGWGMGLGASGEHEAEAQKEVHDHPVQTHCHLNPSIFNSVLHNGDPDPVLFVN